MIPAGAGYHRRVTTRPRPPVPPAVLDAARSRSVAREARDWPTADRLRGEIEAAGWQVVDTGTEFSLVPAHPADVEVSGALRYGRSEHVASRLADPPAAPASVAVVASRPVEETIRAVESLLRYAPVGTTAAIVADGLGNVEVDALEAFAASHPGLEVLVTSTPLGHGAATNMAIRRASGPVVLLLDPSVEATGDAVTPLVRALDDPAIAVAGPFGLVSGDLRHYEEATAGDVAAVQGYLLAFRREDAVARGPLDEHFRFYRNLDIWWSLVLRDAGDEAPPRRAIAVGELPLVRHEHRGWTSVAPRERDRLSKRNFYRIIDRFGHRRDLAVPRPTP